MIDRRTLGSRRRGRIWSDVSVHFQVAFLTTSPWLGLLDSRDLRLMSLSSNKGPRRAAEAPKMRTRGPRSR